MLQDSEKMKRCVVRKQKSCDVCWDNPVTGRSERFAIFLPNPVKPSAFGLGAFTAYTEVYLYYNTLTWKDCYYFSFQNCHFLHW